MTAENHHPQDKPRSPTHKVRFNVSAPVVVLLELCAMTLQGVAQIHPWTSEVMVKMLPLIFPFCVFEGRKAHYRVGGVQLGALPVSEARND